MSLPHNAYLTPTPLVKLVAQAFAQPEAEIDLAASNHFYDFAGHWDEITTAYEAYFEAAVGDLTAILGQPIYRGRWDAPERPEWDAILPEYADAQDLVVWARDSKRLYCRYSWEDKEIPILIAMGGKAAQPQVSPTRGSLTDLRSGWSDGATSMKD